MNAKLKWDAALCTIVHCHRFYIDENVINTCRSIIACSHDFTTLAISSIGLTVYYYDNKTEVCHIFKNLVRTTYFLGVITCNNFRWSNPQIILLIHHGHYNFQHIFHMNSITIFLLVVLKQNNTWRDWVDPWISIFSGL